MNWEHFNFILRNVDNYSSLNFLIEKVMIYKGRYIIKIDEGILLEITI